MALPFPIAPSQTDKKSPVDDVLMDSIREDLDYLDTAVGGGGTGVFEWKVNGQLSALANRLPFRRIDGAFVSAGQTLSAFAAFLEIPGTSGTLEVDVRKYRSPDTPIIGIDKQYSAAIQSITRAGTSNSTQSIARSTAQVATQSIAYWKAAINIDSIILVGSYVRYNLASAVDADWKVGDYVRFESCSNAANNGVFQIVRLNDDDLNNIVIQNANGVAQTGAAGTAKLMAFAYALINPASTEFVAGEKATFASHTTPANNGALELYAVNSGGNNLVVKNSAGAEQAGVAGTIDVLRWTYTLAAAAGADLVVGETGFFSGHTSSANDGNLRITATNSGGNNVTVYNTAGVAQGGVAGSVQSNRWVYALPTDPSSSFSVGQTFRSTSATDYRNNGVFSVVEVNRLAANNLVVHNESGQTQAGVAGTLDHTRRLVKFASSQSAIYSTASRVLLRGLPDGNYLTSEYDVLEVDRGGGANYNIVIDESNGATQSSPAGRVSLESRSVFSTRPTITVARDLRVASNGVLDATEKTIAAGRMLCLEILQIPSGAPENLTVHVA